MKECKILDLIEEAVDKMAECGDTPYAIICSRKTFEKISLYLRTQSPIEEKFSPLQMCFICPFGNLPVVKFKYCPEDYIFVVNKYVYEKIMAQKTLTYYRRGLWFDFGKKTIIKRIG